MKKILSLTFFTIFLIGLNALVYGESADKVTGGSSANPYLNMIDHLDFNAQETDSINNIGKGSVSYSRDGQFAYQLDVKYVRVEPEEHVAWFAGQVTEASNGENLGMWMSFAVCDEEGENCETDRQGYNWIPADNVSAEEQEAIALEWVRNGLPDPLNGTVPVIEGNITVH